MYFICHRFRSRAERNLLAVRFVLFRVSNVASYPPRADRGLVRMRKWVLFRTNLRRQKAYVLCRSTHAYLGLVQVCFLHDGDGWCRITLREAANFSPHDHDVFCETLSVALRISDLLSQKGFQVTGANTSCARERKWSKQHSTPTLQLTITFLPFNIQTRFKYQGTLHFV